MTQRTSRPHGVSADHGGRLWVVLLFFLGVGFDYRLSAGAGPSLAVLELIASLACGIWFLDLVWNQRFVLSGTGAALREWRWVVAYFAWAWITVWIGLSRSAENLFAFRNLLPSFFFGVAVLAHVKTEKQILRCLVAYLAGVLVNVVLAVPQKILGKPYPNPLHEGALIKMDLSGQIVLNSPSGFFVHPNGLAVYLIPAFVFLLFCAFSGYFRKPLLRVGAFFGLLVVGGVMWFTYAKGAIFWAMIGAGIAFVPARLRRYPGWCSMAALSVIPLILFFGTDPFHLGFRTFNSMLTRFEIWGSAISAFRQDPYILLFGNGFRTIYFQTLRLSELPYLNAHNNVLNQILFFGVPALFMYLTSFALAIRSAGLALRRNPGNRLAMLLVGIAVALLGEHFFEPVLDSVALQAQYYGLLALLIASARMGQSQQAESAI